MQRSIYNSSEGYCCLLPRKSKSLPTEDQVVMKKSKADVMKWKSRANENSVTTAARRGSNAENMQILRNSQTLKEDKNKSAMRKSK